LIIDKDIEQIANKILKKAKISSLVIDPTTLKLSSYLNIFKKTKFKIKKKPRLSQSKRIIKTDKEIKYIKKASLIAKKGFKKFEDYLFNHLNKSEFELSYKLKEFISKKKYDFSFEPIVAINENSALPHAKLTNKKFNKNDLILIDAGIKYKRYCSDRTVTIGSKTNDFFQREQFFKDKFKQKIYDIVLKAQELAIKKAKPGVKAFQIDKAAREYIDKKGYGKYFVHSTGHGVGLDIHELPVISSKSGTIIEENMVFTIEPGIYIPDQFGVRIEDMVIIKDRAEVL